MTESQILKLKEIVSAVDNDLRERLKSAGLQIEHAIVAIAPGGAGIVRSNVGPEYLGDMAELLADVADGRVIRRPNDESLN